MDISNIFNPAAVVNTTGGVRGGSNPGDVHDEPGGSRVVSQLSKSRAANGDPRVSAETAEAVANGALPPEVVIEIPQEVAEAVQQTADLQQASQPATEDDAVIVELSNVATELITQPVEAQQVVATQTGTTTQTVKTDTATQAFGNTVDVQA